MASSHHEICASVACWQTCRRALTRPRRCRVRCANDDDLVSWSGFGTETTVTFQQGPRQGTAGLNGSPTCFFDAVVAAATLMSLGSQTGQKRPSAPGKTTKITLTDVLQAWPLDEEFDVLRAEFIHDLRTPSNFGGSANEVWSALFNDIGDLEAHRGYLIYCPDCNLSTTLGQRHSHRLFASGVGTVIQEVAAKVKKQQRHMTMAQLGAIVMQDRQILPCDRCGGFRQEHTRCWLGTMPRYMAIDLGDVKVLGYEHGWSRMECWQAGGDRAHKRTVSYRFKLGIYRNELTTGVWHFSCHGLDIASWKACCFDGMKLGGAIVSDIYLPFQVLPQLMQKTPQIMVLELTDCD